MIDLINNWLQSIVIAVIVATIIEILVPNGNNKKYIKVVIGIYILFVIISPIINKVSAKTFNIEEIVETKEYQDLTGDLTENTEANVEKIYTENLKLEIQTKLEEQNYIVNNIFLTINKKEEEYGNIEYIKISITKKEKTISNIRQININLQEQEQPIEKNNKEEIKKILIENYQIEESKIYIQINE